MGIQPQKLGFQKQTSNLSIRFLKKDKTVQRTNCFQRLIPKKKAK